MNPTKSKKGKKKLEIQILPDEKSSHAMVKVIYENGDTYRLLYVKNIPLISRQNNHKSLKSLKIWIVGDYIVDMEKRSVRLKDTKKYSTTKMPVFQKEKPFRGYHTHIWNKQ